MYNISIRNEETKEETNMANLRQLVAKILADSKKALRYKDIYGPVNKAIEDGEYKTKGKTIDASIRRTLQTNPEFKAVARDLWVLTGEKSTCHRHIHKSSDFFLLRTSVKWNIAKV